MNFSNIGSIIFNIDKNGKINKRFSICYFKSNFLFCLFLTSISVFIPDMIQKIDIANVLLEAF